MKTQRSKRRRVALLAMCFVPALVATYAAIAGIPTSQLRLTRTTIDGGGTMEARSERFTLRGTIGQPDAGTLNYRSLTLNGGFWFPLQPGDCEEDGDVDAGEYWLFSLCFGGPGSGYERGCECFDVDRSGTVDLADFAGMQRSYTGP